PFEFVHAELRHDGDARRDELERLAVETPDAGAAGEPEELRKARMPMRADAERVEPRPLDQRLAVQQRGRRPLRRVAVERDGRHRAVTGINFHARFRISAIPRKVPFFARFVPTKSPEISGKSYSPRTAETGNGLAETRLRQDSRHVCVRREARAFGVQPE